MKKDQPPFVQTVMTRNDLGILAMELYFPSTFVDQKKLEKYYGVSEGKFTIGLGQEKMSFCGDNEDINSMALTAVKKLMDNYAIDYNSVGRIEVGTETIIDKSKSVKTTIMQLFVERGNFEIVGVDNVNACYGGTAALLNSMAWMESSDWDGRYAIVVTGDIAVYAKGPARPTGGAGVAALLIGFNAPLAFERGLSASYFESAYDFYKPNLQSEYPLVDGPLTIECYLRALEHCYKNYMDRLSTRYNQLFSLKDLDFLLFHTPYSKLVQKAVAKLIYIDEMLVGSSKDQAYNEKEYLKKSEKIFQDKTLESLKASKKLGNTYCASLFTGLMSLISCNQEELEGKRVVLFSYGSGLASTMFSLVFKQEPSKMKEILNLEDRLNNRIEVEPEDYEKVMTIRENFAGRSDVAPRCSDDSLFPGTFYLSHVDSLYRRFYLLKEQ